MSRKRKINPALKVELVEILNLHIQLSKIFCATDNLSLVHL